MLVCTYECMHTNLKIFNQKVKHTIACQEVGHSGVLFIIISTLTERNRRSQQKEFWSKDSVPHLEMIGCQQGSFTMILKLGNSP